MTPTPHKTIVFWKHMCSHYGTRVISKEEAVEMRLAGRGLEWLQIMSHERFMNRYTTVWGTRIYPWFTVGRGDTEALWKQIVVCTHEHQHVVQFRREGLPRYAARYGLSRRERARLEAEAYCCNFELNWWRNGKLLDPESTAEILYDYGCREPDVELARREFEACRERLERGEIRNEATRVALSFLDA